MKKITILLFAIGMITVASAQNYIGLTKTQIISKLDKTNLAYSQFINQNNGRTIKVDYENESKYYVFDFSLTCNKYMIMSDREDFIYDYSMKLLNNGYKTVTSPRYSSSEVEMISRDYYAYFTDESKNERFDAATHYKYALIIKKR